MRSCSSTLWLHPLCVCEMPGERFLPFEAEGPVMAKMVLPKNNYCPRDQIWQPYLVLGPNMAAIFGPRGPHIAARFDPRTE